MISPDAEGFARIAAEAKRASESFSQATRDLESLTRAAAEAKRAVDQAHPADEISDGYHTFGELYAHRRALTAALCRAIGLDAWKSKAHHPDDDPMFEGGWFIVGVNLPTGTVSYHYELKYWDDFEWAIELPHAPKWDGHTPQDVVGRLLEWAR